MARRRLLLLRHAKAVTGSPAMADIDRPLAPRGEAAARLMGRYMAENGLLPDLVLCSPARRTRETWAGVAAGLPHTGMRIVEELYDFGSGEALLEVIRAEGGAAECLLLVTHNPATQNLALALAATGDKALRRRMIEKFPTAGLALLSFEGGSWAGTAAAQARLEGFVTPRELA